LALVGIFALGVCASMIAYRQFYCLCNPLVPISSMALAYLLAWLSSKA